MVARTSRDYENISEKIIGLVSVDLGRDLVGK